MFDSEFYPTPRSVVEKMIEPFKKDLRKKYILEPSAGKGDILDVLTGDRSVEFNGHWYRDSGISKKRVYCVEQNPELVYILQEKGYKVLGNDFLAYKPQYAIDLVLMNPPFSNGDEHLLHAWNTLESGDIVCLLNAETINNPYSYTRELLLKIISDHGTVEMLGDCFRTAERKTNVNVAMVRLHKASSTGRFDFDFEPTSQERNVDFSEDIQNGNQLAVDDKLGTYLRIYDNAKDAAVEYIKAKARLEYYAKVFLEQNALGNLISNAESEGNGDKRATFNSFVDELKNRAWTSILSKVGIERYMTSNVRKNFNKYKQTQGACDLTRENIAGLVRFICGASDQILNQAVIDVFDIFTKYHKDNRCFVEGWKTNSAWKVNRKVILPNFISSDYEYFDKNRHYYEEYSDIDRAMCYLSGKRWDDFNEVVGEYLYRTPEREKRYKMESLERAISRVKVGDSGKYESEFFTFRCYKKGTLHIWFKDEALWARFNQVACQGKFALGGDF